MWSWICGNWDGRPVVHSYVMRYDRTMKFKDTTSTRLHNAARSARIAYLEAPKYDRQLHEAWLTASSATHTPERQAMNLSDHGVPFTSTRDPLHDHRHEAASAADEARQSRGGYNRPPLIQSTPDVWTR